jgi:hypothetical protein
VRTMWFESLTGFCERSPQQVHENISIDGELLVSRVNGRVMVCGRLETPTLADLRQRVKSSGYAPGKLSVREVVGDVQRLHADESLAGSLFQVASQFNLLEMMSPAATPEHGVGIYEHDRTQGPACAIAAGAGTIYRNYFANTDGHTGQTAAHQIDCLADLGKALGNSGNRLWTMTNGYAMATADGLAYISKLLRAADEKELDRFRGLLRIGIQWNTQVTLDDSRHNVSQAYCSALPIAYCDHAVDLWRRFATLILEASYEATICGAILNACSNGVRTVFLTLLGGGAFGNPVDWCQGRIES